jgi:N-acetylmuramic acid 6-phosphate (MurNAc-6-P) etherase
MNSTTRVRAALATMATMCRNRPGDALNDGGRLTLANAASAAGTSGVAEILDAAPRIWDPTTRGEYAMVLDKAAYALADGEVA